MEMTQHGNLGPFRRHNTIGFGQLKSTKDGQSGAAAGEVSGGKRACNSNEVNHRQSSTHAAE
jgi:hypothetical protein